MSGADLAGRWSWARWVLVLALIALSACSSGWRLQAPQIKVSDISFQGGNLFEQRFSLALRVYNPNEREIRIESMRFALATVASADAAPFARGESSTPTILPGLSETVVSLDGRAQLLSVLADLPRLLDANGRLPYRLSGDVLSQEYGRIPFDRQGLLDLPEKLRGKTPPPDTGL